MALPGLLRRAGRLLLLTGLGLLIAIVLTAIYVWKANTTFDDLTRALLEETR